MPATRVPIRKRSRGAAGFLPEPPSTPRASYPSQPRPIRPIFSPEEFAAEPNVEFLHESPAACKLEFETTPSSPRASWRKASPGSVALGIGSQDLSASRAAPCNRDVSSGSPILSPGELLTVSSPLSSGRGLCRYGSWLQALDCLEQPIDRFHLGHSHAPTQWPTSMSLIANWNIRLIIRSLFPPIRKVDWLCCIVHRWLPDVPVMHHRRCVVADPTGQIAAAIEGAVMSENAEVFEVGSTLMLRDVPVIRLQPSAPQLVVTRRSLMKIFAPTAPSQSLIQTTQMARARWEKEAQKIVQDIKVLKAEVEPSGQQHENLRSHRVPQSSAGVQRDGGRSGGDWDIEGGLEQSVMRPQTETREDSFGWCMRSMRLPEVKEEVLEEDVMDLMKLLND